MANHIVQSQVCLSFFFPGSRLSSAQSNLTSSRHVTIRNSPHRLFADNRARESAWRLAQACFLWDDNFLLLVLDSAALCNNTADLCFPRFAFLRFSPNSHLNQVSAFPFLSHVFRMLPFTIHQASRSPVLSAPYLQMLPVVLNGEGRSKITQTITSSFLAWD